MTTKLSALVAGVIRAGDIGGLAVIADWLEEREQQPVMVRNLRLTLQLCSLCQQTLAQGLQEAYDGDWPPVVPRTDWLHPTLPASYHVRLVRRVTDPRRADWLSVESYLPGLGSWRAIVVCLIASNIMLPVALRFPPWSSAVLLRLALVLRLPVDSLTRSDIVMSVGPRPPSDSRAAFVYTVTMLVVPPNRLSGDGVTEFLATAADCVGYCTIQPSVAGTAARADYVRRVRRACAWMLVICHGKILTEIGHDGPAAG